MQVYYMHTFIYTLVQLQLKDIYSSWLVIPRADKGMGTVNRCSSLAEGEKKEGIPSSTWRPSSAPGNLNICLNEKPTGNCTVLWLVIAR